jgi:hypothetical protein
MNLQTMQSGKMSYLPEHKVFSFRNSVTLYNTKAGEYSTGQSLCRLSHFFTSGANSPRSLMITPTHACVMTL